MDYPIYSIYPCKNDRKQSLQKRNRHKLCNVTCFSVVRVFNSFIELFVMAHSFENGILKPKDQEKRRTMNETKIKCAQKHPRTQQ